MSELTNPEIRLVEQYVGVLDYRLFVMKRGGAYC
jgi:hypothetical protein